ncbi:sulfatase-like hydrolase/transferase [Engelhardtia mirabilis]|uniref:Arylsulfatase n=1 Tax=Engelhardtia mirabilis TaxID=2528011 RepID=A0A518BNX6_9BACT|nr:Arylsulfatase precursor [Planctomycetes bacterium Pla133]QDV03009.1 Arylsulfatase precursor [Planctomycetes bacterium Pla86]
MIDPRRALASAVFLALVVAPSASAIQGQRTTPPNVLLIVLDDVGVDQLGVYAEATNPPPTPNLDALAAQSVLFRQAWSNPVCSPTRAALMTGRHGFRTGVGNAIGSGATETGLPLSETILPELLDTGGQYVHAAFGKWHLGGAADGALAPNNAGFGHYDGCLSNLDIVASNPASYTNWPRVVDGVESVSTQYLTSATVDSALGWISQQTEPWFAYVAFHAVHSPFHWPPAALHSVNPASIPPGNPAHWQHRAMVEALDTEIGRLLSGVGAPAGDLTVIVVGDNGTAGPGIEPPFDPTHGKHTLFDGGVRVPLLISGPTVSAPGECQALVQVLDLFATVAEIAGVNPATIGKTIDSRSLVPYLANPTAVSERSVLFSERFWGNGVGKGVPSPQELVAADPSLPAVCQTDLGFAGPGPSPPVLALCGAGGQGLVDGNLLMLTLDGAPPLAPGLLVVGVGAQPIPLVGGTLVPSPLVVLLPLATNALGSLHLPVVGAVFSGFGFNSIVAQAVIVDPSQPLGNVFSNAVGGLIPTLDRKSVEDLDGYKLIITAHGGQAQLFDRSQDPFEQVNLLAGGEANLSVVAAQHLASLRAELLALLATQTPGP